MSEAFRLVRPALLPALDAGFRPAVLANRAFVAEVQATGQGVPLVLGLVRPGGARSRFETVVFPEGHPRFEANFRYAERLFKFLLWAQGGHQAYVGGPRALADHLRSTYHVSGARAFDARFMGEDVYGVSFEVIGCTPEEVPTAHEVGKPLGRHLEGCRIGFDLGASDRKVSALVDGVAVYSEEVVWEPRRHEDPEYHYREVMAALKAAASHLPRVDAIGGSSAGVLVDSEVRIASLFRSVPRARYHEVRTLFLRIRQELGVPLEVVNDGDVTALAGAMGLEQNGILGIALGSSEAAGYVDPHGHLLGWLSELAFAPVDYSPEAPEDEWSGDRGVGGLYFSQQAVFRLAPRAGILLPQGGTDAERLEFVQGLLEGGHPGAEAIWRTLGTYLGYALAHYADVYDVQHVLILGRCTSGRGGALLLEETQAVLAKEFPELAHLRVQLPDEKSRRVGQAIAAASLPAR